MMYKIALIAALCVAQGFAFEPRDKHPPKGPCKNPAFDIEEKVPEDFDEAMHEMDEVTETVGMAAMEAYFKGQDPDVVIECYREQKENFAALGQRIHRKLREADQEMAQLLGNKYEPYRKRMEIPMRAIGMAMRDYPVKIWLHIKEKEFSQAFEVMREFRRTVQMNSRIMGGIMREMAEEFPECAERAQELCREIRQEARNGCIAIKQNIHKCIEAGGPNKPHPNPTQNGAELEEAPEQ